jgi:hypothetical protein
MEFGADHTQNDPEEIEETGVLKLRCSGMPIQSVTPSSALQLDSYALDPLGPGFLRMKPRKSIEIYSLGKYKNAPVCSKNALLSSPCYGAHEKVIFDSKD